MGKSLFTKTVEDLTMCATLLSSKHSHDLNAVEFASEVASFKFQAISLFTNLQQWGPLDLLQQIHKLGLQDIYPNLEVALRTFLTLPVSIASCERTFSKLKIIKNYLRSSIAQERLSNLSIISIEFMVANSLDYDDLIDKFASEKARKVSL